MRLRAGRIVAGMACVAGLGVAWSGPADAVLAGQFCSDAQLGIITTADNGAIVTCEGMFNAPNRWVASNLPPVSVTTTVAPNRTGIISTGATSTVPAVASDPSNRTGIISVSPVTTRPVTPVVTVAPVTSGARLALTG